jgi:hypothetical protein
MSLRRISEEFEISNSRMVWKHLINRLKYF